MEHRRLGRTDLMVSALCLGSMTWGTQNTEAEGHAQIDQALDHGVDFIDTAEMYPTTPLGPETTGDTERIIGSWVAKTGRRADVVIATKVIGDGYAAIRDGGPITPEAIRIAVDGSLARLQTDYIDLYQLHWPNRGSYHFRKNWTYDPTPQPDRAAVREDMLAALEALDELIRAGKIRHVGLSNETAWGVAQWAALSDAHGLPRMVSIQNEYSLMCRLFDTDLAEASRQEEIGLLAYTPLAGGILTGKYSGGAIPAGSRASIGAQIGGRRTERALLVADAYGALARAHGLDPTQMALAWCMTRPFMTSVIFGATTPAQLDVCLGAAEITLSEAVLTEINALHCAHPMPF